MNAITPGFKYDIFISFSKDEKEGDIWVSTFVASLEEELATAIGSPVSIYFEGDGKDKSSDSELASNGGNLSSAILIPIVSEKYCDDSGSAWNEEFMPFLEGASADGYGLNIKPFKGSPIRRVIPVLVHDLDTGDKLIFEEKLNGPLGAIDFVHRDSGVYRPLTPGDNNLQKRGRTLFDDQVGKVALEVKAVIDAIRLLNSEEAVSSDSSRVLAAIMFTDIVGYTKMMGSDEKRAMELLDINRSIQKPLIQRYNGQWHKEMGDGVLATFSSVSDAVYCSIAIQREAANHPDLNLRIGIHQGEVVFQDGDVFGDGVNIASRIESIATAGGIYVSESVNINVQNKQGIETDFVNEIQLKNVREPVRVYEVHEAGQTSSTHLGNRPSAMVSMDESMLNKLREVIKQNIDNERFSVEDLAREMAVSRSHLHRKLHRITGKSISQYVRGLRLDQAHKMLRADVGTVSEIAYKVGFASDTYFIKCFSEEFGISPGEAKKRPLEAEADHTSTAVLEVVEDQKTVTSGSLESLHPAASESMIIEIFNDLIKFKPSLEKYLIIDEEEEDGFDARLLAYQLIKAYPWPIGIELRRLFSASLLKSGVARRDQLDISITRSLKLITYIFISDVTTQINAGRFKLSKEEGKQIHGCLREITAEGILSILKVLADATKDAAPELFVEELGQCFDGIFFREMEDWIEDFKQNQNDLEVAEQCEGLEQILMFLLQRFAFLARYRLVNMGPIEVRKRKYQEASFRHNLQVLSSVDAEFKIRRELMEQFADSNAVLLMKNIREPRDFINLSPLVVDTHGIEVQSQEKQKLKRDIFLYDNSKNHTVEYVGSGSNTKDDLSYLDYHDDLSDEYTNMLKLISGNE